MVLTITQIDTRLKLSTSEISPETIPTGLEELGDKRRPVELLVNRWWLVQILPHITGDSVK